MRSSIGVIGLEEVNVPRPSSLRLLKTTKAWHGYLEFLCGRMFWQTVTNTIRNMVLLWAGRLFPTSNYSKPLSAFQRIGFEDSSL